MGREAACTCVMGKTIVAVKALLESNELVLRGEVRRKFPFAEMKKIQVDGEELRFAVGNQSVSLVLGSAQAVKWAEAIANPPTLSKKLGITPESTILMLGPVDDDAVGAVLSVAAEVLRTERLTEPVDLILARVDTPEALSNAIEDASNLLARRVPIWVIYPKGPGKSLSESAVRDALLARGMTDTKVAAVSARLTALRFVKRAE